MVGSFGAAEIFSFHATKFVNSAEGGAVVTNDDTLAEKMRLMKNFSFAGYDNVIDVGTNGKMSELSAAMGMTSLESIDHFVKSIIETIRPIESNSTVSRESLLSHMTRGNGTITNTLCWKSMRRLHA